MKNHFLKSRGVMMMGLMSAAFTLNVQVASAQQPADAPAAKPSVPIPSIQPAPTLVPGRGDIPSAEIGKRLANVAPPPMGVPEDKLPKLTVPKGFNVEVIAHGIGNARTLRMGDKVRLNGTVTWVVAGVSLTFVYLTNQDVPTWAPQRFAPGVVTHVKRGNEWVPVETATGEPNA